MNPRRLLPLRLPEWSRALWLALLLLCSALLMPPRADATRSTSHVRESRSAITMQRSQFAPADGAAAETRQTPHVQVIAPTDMIRINLAASSDDKEMKSAILKELLGKIGNVPESELAPEVREILNTLRTETGVKTDEGAKQDEKTGTQQKVGAAGTKTDVNPAVENGSATIGEFSEKAFSRIGQSFPDVKEQLEKYYKSSTDERK